MSHEHDCLASGIQRFEDLQNFRPGGRIKISGRFVTEDNPWSIDQSSSDRHALALATAGFARVDYFELVDGETLATLDAVQQGARLMAAGVVGTTRLLVKNDHRLSQRVHLPLASDGRRPDVIVSLTRYVKAPDP